MFMRFQKGQAAMEYLVTYGWVLFLIVAVMSFMMASGVFSTSRFVNQQCTFQPDFPCEDYAIVYGGDTTKLLFNITNGLGFPIMIDSMEFETEGIGVSGRQEWDSDDPGFISDPSLGEVIAQGEEVGFEMPFPGSVAPTKDSIRDIEVTIVYKNCATAEDPSQCTPGNTVSTHTISGIVTGQVIYI